MRIKARDDFYHSTLTGAALRMNKGDIKEVSEELALQVIADGKAFPMEDDDTGPAPAPAKEPESAKEPEPTKTETETEEADDIPLEPEIVNAMVTIAEEGDEDKLTQDGKPKAFAVKDFLGYSVDSEARENAWYHAQKQLPKE